MKKESSFLGKPVILEGVRTPFRHSHKAFANLNSFDLGSYVLQGLLTKVGLDSSAIEHVIMGTVLHEPRTPNIARECLLGAGYSSSIPAHTVSLACISSNVATTEMANMISLGQIKMGIVGGVDTCSDPPIRVAKSMRKKLVRMSKFRGLKDASKYLALLLGLRPKDFALDIPQVTEFSNGKSMGQGAEILAQQTKVSRDEADAYAARSHQLAVKAMREGIFEDYILPVYTPPKFEAILEDDGPREDTNLKSLAKLRRAFDKDFGVCTAGNSSFLTDGASALLLSDLDTAKKKKLEPKAIISDFVYRAGDPLTEMLSGPALTIPHLLERNNLSLDDIDVWEIHEAFASQVLSNLVYLNSDIFAKDRLGLTRAPGEIPIEKINIWGGSLSIGHPFGATGCRLLYTASMRLQKQKARYAIVSGCAAGGHGSAILLENPNL